MLKCTNKEDLCNIVPKFKLKKIQKIYKVAALREALVFQRHKAAL